MTKRECRNLPDFNLIRKIVWSFKKKSKESWEDLFQEAYIGYTHALETYDPNKGNFSTHVWHCTHNQIINFVRLESSKNGHIIATDLFDVEEPCTDFFERLPVESQKIAAVVINAPEPFIFASKQEVLSLLNRLIPDYTANRIKLGVKGLEMACNS